MANWVLIFLLMLLLLLLLLLLKAQKIGFELHFVRSTINKSSISFVMASYGILTKLVVNRYVVSVLHFYGTCPSAKCHIAIEIAIFQSLHGRSVCLSVSPSFASSGTSR